MDMYAFGFLVVTLIMIVLLWVYAPTIFLIIRYVIDDKSWDAMTGKDKIINHDGTAFDGRWGPVIVAFAVIFLFLFLLLV